VLLDRLAGAQGGAHRKRIRNRPRSRPPREGVLPQGAGDHSSIWFLIRARSVNFWEARGGPEGSASQKLIVTLSKTALWYAVPAANLGGSAVVSV
jgi:hypothetical protein